MDLDVGLGARPDRRQARHLAVAQREGRRHEAVEQRVRAVWAGLELRVELGGDEARVVASSTISTSRSSGEVPEGHPRLLENRPVAVVDLEPVAVALVDGVGTVERVGHEPRASMAG